MRFDFASPAFLPALALALLPLIIHLVSRRIARDQRFAALEFVLRATKRRSRHIRLRQLLLLLLRTLLIAAAVLAMSQPQLVPKTLPSQKPQGHSLIICLDASASMQARSPDSDDSLFDLARAQAEKALRKLAPGLPAWVLLAGPQVQPLTPRVTLNRRALINALDDVKAGLGRSDLGACVAMATRAKQADPNPRVLIISDGAAHAWRSLPSDGQAEIELSRVPSEQTPQLENFSLGPVQVSPSSTDNQAVDISLRVMHSAASKSQAEVSLSLMREEQVLSTITAAPAAGSQITKQFMQISLGEKQTHDLLQIQATADAFALDDISLAPVELPRRLRVLLIDGDPQAVHYRDEIFYLERALKEERPGSAPLQVQVQNLSHLSVHDLAQQDVVFLANVGRFDDELVQALIQSVRTGTGLLIGAGDNVDVDFYNNALANLLPARLRGKKVHQSLEAALVPEQQRLEIVDNSHPLIRALGPQPGLARARTKTVLLVDPTPNVKRIDILRFSGGTPALSERRIGKGRVLLLGTSLDRDWSDLAIRPGFLPLMQQAVVYLADALVPPHQRNFIIGESVPLPQIEDGRALIITHPDGHNERVPLDPNQSPQPWAGAKTLGLYQISVELDANSTRPLFDWRFVVQVDPQESDTRLLDSAQLAKRLPRGMQVRSAQNTPPTGLSLWPYLLLLLIALALAEAWATWRRS